jgi:putative transposase
VPELDRLPTPSLLIRPQADEHGLWGRSQPIRASSAPKRFRDSLYVLEIRTVLCSTNAIESLNARYRRAVTVRGHFPTEQAALKCLYLVTRSLDPKGTGQTR